MATTVLSRTVRYRPSGESFATFTKNPATKHLSQRVVDGRGINTSRTVPEFFSEELKIRAHGTKALTNGGIAAACYNMYNFWSSRTIK